MAAPSYQMTLNDYLMILRRRAVLIILAFSLTFAAAVAVAVVIPPTYESTGVILVESQQIPTDFVQATVTTRTEQQIQVIRQRVMTRDNLFRIVDKYGLFQGEDMATVPASQKLDEMRRWISVEPISAGGGRSATTIAFRVSFEHRSPQIAYRVANELVTLFLDENAKARTQRASETTEFLSQEARKLKAELDALENQLATYKQEHADALPEHLDLHMGMLQRAESALADVEREYKSTQEELRFLDVELSAAKAGVGSRSKSEGPLGPAAELEQLKAQYSELRGRYTETHPDVKAVKRTLEALEATLSAEEGAETEAEPRATSVSQLMVAKIQTRMDAARSRLASLSEQRTELKAEIERLQARIIKTPQVERALSAITRDHQNVRRKYEEIRAKQVDATIAESLEEGKKAERFVLLEPPLLPDTPAEPDRMQIALMGFALAGGSAGGLAFAVEFLNQRIRGAGALAALIRQPPLVVVPYITTADEIRRRRRRIALLIAAAVLLVAVAAALVHFLYTPLDLLFLKIMARLG